MPYINYAKVNAQRSAKSSAVTSVTKSFSSIPWEKVYQLYLAAADEWEDTATADRKSTRLNSSHVSEARMPSSA